MFLYNLLIAMTALQGWRPSKVEAAHEKITKISATFVFTDDKGHTISLALFGRDIDNTTRQTYEVRYTDTNSNCSYTKTESQLRKMDEKLAMVNNGTNAFIITVNGSVLSDNQGIMFIKDIHNDIFLPFPVKYLASILTKSSLYQTALREKAAKKANKVVQFDIPILEPCLKTYANKERSEPQMSLFLFHAAAGVLEVQNNDRDWYICQVQRSKKIGVDMELRRRWLEYCCQVQDLDMEQRKDARRRTGDVNATVNVHIHCQRPDEIRENTIVIAKVLSVILTLLSPLLLRLIPSQPWRLRHIAHLRSTPAVAAEPLTVTKETPVTEVSGLNADDEGQLDLNSSSSGDEGVEETKRKKARFDMFVCDRKRRKKQRKLQWITLDGDSVYNFGVSMVIYYVCLFHKKWRPLTVLRRAVVVLGCMAMTAYLYDMFWLFYYYLLHVEFVNHHVWMVGIFGHYSITQDEQHENTHLMPFIVAACYTVLLFLIMPRSMLISKDICKSLLWREKGCFFGYIYKPLDGPKTAMDKILSLEPGYNASWEYLLMRNLTFRISCLFSLRFWKFWWRDCICGWNPFQKMRRRCCAHALYAIWVFFRFLVFLLLLVLYVIPAFSILHGVAHNAFFKTAKDRKRRVVNVINFVSTTLGICLVYTEVIVFFYLFLQLVIFIGIDILRNISSSLSYLIVFASVVLYVNGSFTAIADEYRKIKEHVFDIAQSIKPPDENVDIRCNFPPYPPLLQYTGNDENLLIPKPVFDTVCHHCLPLGKCVAKKMVTLIASLLIIGVIFKVVLLFQIFGSFSKEGDAVITLLTVSVPRLFGAMASQKVEDLKMAKMKNRVASIIKRLIIFVPKEDSIM